jgi:hypothetical protein
MHLPPCEYRFFPFVYIPHPFATGHPYCIKKAVAEGIMTNPVTSIHYGSWKNVQHMYC